MPVILVTLVQGAKAGGAAWVTLFQGSMHSCARPSEQKTHHHSRREEEKKNKNKKTQNFWVWVKCPWSFSFSFSKLQREGKEAMAVKRLQQLSWPTIRPEAGSSKFNVTLVTQLVWVRSCLKQAHKAYTNNPSTKEAITGRHKFKISLVWPHTNA